MQSDAWEKFQAAFGMRTERVDGQLMIEHPTVLGRYWYCPRPALLGTSTLAALKDAAVRNAALFVRIDPDLGYDARTLTGQSTVRTLPTAPQDSLLLDVSPSEDALLESFHTKLRYNIRLAMRRGLTVSHSSNPTGRELMAFLELAKGTGGRQQFHYHPVGYYQTMLELLGEVGQELTVSCLVVWHEQVPVAALILLIDHPAHTAYYLHGASSYPHRAFMGPHLVQWEAIRTAKAAGALQYDFWGIAPEAAPNDHPWTGITRFKLGFGGVRVRYSDSFDLIVDPVRSRLYRLARSIRRRL